MDIAKPSSKPLIKKSYVIGLVVLVALALLWLVLTGSGASVKIERNQLLLGKVQRGNLRVSVEGYGVLRSDKQTLITALTAATVEEVVLRSGAEVEADSIIMRLNNPEVLQEVEAANMALIQEQANLRRLKLSNQRELLAEQSNLADVVASLKTVQLRADAEKGLAGGAVSMLVYQTTLLQLEQMQQRVALQTKRVEQLEDVFSEAIIIQQEQINRANAQLQRAQQRADKLIVRAGIKGVLQRSPVELGQSVAAGQELALVGSDKDLKALIRISQSRVDQIKLGQAARINTRREQVAGKVSRITPEVRDGTIEVEILFTEAVPASARPELNVDAEIYTADIKNTLFVERPVNVQNHSSASLFKLADDKKGASLQEFNFGAESGKYIQVLKGAKENDLLILSDMTNIQDATEITIL
ncbi:MAG: HlyD family efflux transporter periplasmic adaptor subunit [Cellvibrio sp.]|nr:HlyD family efflux transporter periplasmic adaptor subunit [Cellvibrio sp.]